MNKEDFWRTFCLNRELHVAGAFIYDGLREFWRLRTFNSADEVFQVMYPLAVGFERLMKIAIVLLEYKVGMDQEQFEKSLITHSHQALLQRIRAVKQLNLGTEHHELIEILGRFYKTYRYDRFNLKSAFSSSCETVDLLQYLSKYIPTLGSRDDFFGEEPNCPREVKIFLARVCRKLATDLYELIETAARDVNLFTYEIRCYSKAFKVFIMVNDIGFFREDLVWKEVLVYLMNTRQESAELTLLREIQPLNFDAGMISDYLECLASDTKRIEHVEELKELYNQISDTSEREDMMEVIGDGFLCFEEDESDDQEQAGPERKSSPLRQHLKEDEQ